MTLDEFVQINTDKKLDYDGSFGAQCVDLYRFYVKDVLAVDQTPPVASAYQIFNSAPDKDFIKIKNEAHNFPLKGDIVIWTKDYGDDGHVAVCLAADQNNLIVFEQNNPIGSPSHVGEHNFNFVLGWLRPKAGVQGMNNIEFVLDNGTVYLVGTKDDGSQAKIGINQEPFMEVFKEIADLHTKSTAGIPQVKVIEPAPEKMVEPDANTFIIKNS